MWSGQKYSESSAKIPVIPGHPEDISEDVPLEELPQKENKFH